jgi:hypothetical protein
MTGLSGYLVLASASTLRFGHRDLDTFTGVARVENGQHFPGVVQTALLGADHGLAQPRRERGRRVLDALQQLVRVVVPLLFFGHLHSQKQGSVAFGRRRYGLPRSGALVFDRRVLLQILFGVVELARLVSQRALHIQHFEVFRIGARHGIELGTGTVDVLHLRQRTHQQHAQFAGFGMRRNEGARGGDHLVGFAVDSGLQHQGSRCFGIRLGSLRGTGFTQGTRRVIRGSGGAGQRHMGFRQIADVGQRFVKDVERAAAVFEAAQHAPSFDDGSRLFRCAGRGDARTQRGAQAFDTAGSSSERERGLAGFDVGRVQFDPDLRGVQCTHQIT